MTVSIIFLIVDCKKDTDCYNKPYIDCLDNKLYNCYSKHKLCICKAVGVSGGC